MDAGDYTASVAVGGVTAEVSFTTAKAQPEVPAAPVVQKVTQTSITVKTVSGQEYSLDGDKRVAKVNKNGKITAKGDERTIRHPKVQSSKNGPFRVERGRFLGVRTLSESTERESSFGITREQSMLTNSVALHCESGAAADF